MQNDHKFRSPCPLSCLLEIIGDKWSLLILRDMIFYKKRTFKGFSTSAECIASNVLTDKLQKLQSHGLVEKSQSAENKRVNYYNLTQAGLDLTGLILEGIVWFLRNNAQFSYDISREDEFLLKRYAADRDALLREILDEHQAITSC